MVVIFLSFPEQLVCTGSSDTPCWHLQNAAFWCHARCRAECPRTLALPHNGWVGRESHLAKGSDTDKTTPIVAVSQV